jgi:hypothetical protein
MAIGTIYKTFKGVIVVQNGPFLRELMPTRMESGTGAVG